MTDAAPRTCIPANWAGEIMPELQTAPDKFLARVNGGWRLCSPNPDEAEEPAWNEAIEPGRVVQFMWFEDRGTFTLTVHPDRSFTTDRSVPATATHFWIPFDTDTLSDSLEEMVAETDGGLEPGDYDIRAGHWSGSIAYRFEVDGDSGRFVPCAGAN